MEYIFTLKDLRVALGIKKYEMAARLGMEPATYCAIEEGRKKPTIDALRDLAAMFGTSMDFVYNAYYGKGVKYDDIGKLLEYELRKVKQSDALYVGNWHRPPYMPVDREGA